MATCLIGLGSNLGEREQILLRAVQLLRSNSNLDVQRVSSFHASKPAGGPTGQPEFLNAAAVVETSLRPHALLAALQSVENELGRVRSQRWGQRNIDLDLLLYDQLELEMPDLVLPHPRMSFRRFVLIPSSEIAAELVYPINGWTIGKLLEHSNRSEKYIATSFLGPDFLRLLRERVFFRLLKGRGVSSLRHELASDSLSSHLIYARCHAEILDLTTWVPTTEWTLSDFWYPGLSLPMEYFLPARYRNSSEIRAILDEQRRQIVQPKLIVMRQSWSERGLPDTDQFNPEIDAERRRPDVGPVLMIGPDEPDTAIFAEVLAAMQAME